MESNIISTLLIYFGAFISIIDYVIKFILIYIMILSIKSLKKYLKNN
ncbi:hypothetical protein TVTCOM_20400 [Terrisporobacter vanillatitrophus]